MTGPAPYEWVTDGVTVTIDGTYTVEVDAPTAEGTQPQTIHITPIDDRFAFYSDCGDLV